MFQLQWRQRFVENGFQKWGFFCCQKLKISCSLDHTILFNVQIHKHVVQTFLKKCMAKKKKKKKKKRPLDFQCQH